MIPLRDENPTDYFPLITIAVMAINVIAFLYTLTLGSEVNINNFYMTYGMIPAVLLRKMQTPPMSPYPYWITILTSMFLHGGFVHIIGNMLFFWIFGNNIESFFGSFFFFIFYLAGGVVAAFTHILSNPSSQVPVIGASGAVAAVMGAYFYLYPKAKIDTLVIFYFITIIKIPAFIFLLIWFLVQFLQGTFGAAGSIAVWAHIGGFVFGAAIAFIIKNLRHDKQVDYYSF